jgi:NAD(P)-dependent dehydrogenase (short-subunit alcohol dehydrogenase family)
MGALQGRVVLVAGATRGAGRGIARALGEAGAVVYCSGRSTRARPRERGASPFAVEGRPETIEETAELCGGVPVPCDHTDAAQVRALAGRIERECGGLDLLVNDVWGGDALLQSLDDVTIEGLRQLFDRALFTHVITARAMLPLLERRRGLVVEVTDGDGLHFRGSLVYDLIKTSVLRLAFGLSEELRPRGISACAITPGFLRSEAMLEHFGVSEATWREGAAKDRHFAFSETPLFVGRAVAALAAEPDRAALSGRLFSSWELARRHGFTDADGSCPDWGRHADAEAFREAERASHGRFVAGATPRRP